MHHPFPVLGHNVWWSLAGAEIQHTDLITLLAQHGFAQHTPDPPTEIKSLRRAITAWLKARGSRSIGANDLDASEVGLPMRKNARRDLVRPINHRTLCYAVFALVAEDIDFAALGLRHGTRARILLEKLTPAERAQREPKLLVTTEAEGGIAAADEAQWLTDELRPYWQLCRGLHQGEDLSRLMTEIVLGMPTAIRLKDRGGLYFVAARDQEQVDTFTTLIAALPSTHDQPWCVALPVIDEVTSRRELAGAVHRGFVAELQALQHNLVDLRSKSTQVGNDTVASRLTQYRMVQQRVQVYADLLGMQRMVIEDGLTQLRAQAHALLVGHDPIEAVSVPDSVVWQQAA
jgi:hypothetical protein